MDKDRQLRLFVLPGLLVALVLAIMHWYGDANGLLVNNIWYDKAMHTMGGSMVCAFTFCWITNLNADRRWAILRWGLPLVGVVCALLGGSVWEWAEWYFPIMTDYVPQGRWDTTFDLVFDSIGGYVAGNKYQKIWRWQL